jgi:hypothetical protein
VTSGRSNEEITVNKIEGVQRGGSHSRGRRAERGSSYILTRGVHKGEAVGNGRESLTFREGEEVKQRSANCFALHNCMNEQMAFMSILALLLEAQRAFYSEKRPCGGVPYFQF